MGTLKRRIIESMEPKEEPPMNIVERITQYLAECDAASCREMEPDPEPLLLACRDEIIAARACAEMMLQGTGQKLGEELARRVMDEHYPPRWIPVSERLPDASVQHGYCLVSDGTNVGTANYTADKFGGGRFWLIESRDEWQPTHWMPLPEPPPDTRDVLRQQWDKMHGK